VAFRFTLPRGVMERLTARAIREGRSVEGLVAELIERDIEH
jgi:plasmid stability protein